MSYNTFKNDIEDGNSPGKYTGPTSATTSGPWVSCSKPADLRLPCTDSFCQECLQEHLATRMKNGEKLTCPKCRVAVPNKIVTKYLQSGATTMEKVDPTVQWCPHKKCFCKVRVNPNASGPQKVTCDVGHEFCATCNENWHEDKKCKDGRSTCACTMHAKARKCPGWKTIIQLWQQKEGVLYKCDSWSKKFCWLCGELYHDSVEDSNHSSWYLPCRTGIIPGWLMLVLYVFLPIIIPIAPFFFACKYTWRKIDQGGLTHEICWWNTGRHRYNPNREPDCCDWIVLIFILIATVICAVLSLVCLALLPFIYIFLIYFHCQQCKLQAKEKEVFY